MDFLTNDYKGEQVLLTGSPQHMTLLIHSGTHSAVAVGGAILTRLTILKKHIGWAVWGDTSAVLW